LHGRWIGGTAGHNGLAFAVGRCADLRRIADDRLGLSGLSVDRAHTGVRRVAVLGAAGRP
jgi:hypothetical protein